MYKTGENKSIVSLAGGIVLTLLIGTTVWVPAFITTPTILATQGSGILYKAIEPLFTPFTSSLLTLIFLICLGCWGCWQVEHHRLVKTASILPAFFMLFLPGLFLSEHGFSPGLPACICLYTAFSRIIVLCPQEDVQWRSLEMGFFVALATLFAPTFVFYIPLCLIGIHLLNRLTFQNLLASIIGIITPYILLVGFLFLTNQSDELVQLWQMANKQFCLSWQWGLHEGILLGLIGISLLVALMGFLHQHTDRIHPRAITSFAFVLAFGALILSLLYHNAHHTISLCMFASLLLTQYFNYRSQKLTRVFFYTFISSCLFVYGTLFIA